MKKFLVVLFCVFMFTDVVYAEQFRTCGDSIVNKQMVTHIRLKGDNYIEIYYPAGTSYAPAGQQIIKYSTKTQRDQKLKEMMAWLNSKD